MIWVAVLWLLAGAVFASAEPSDPARGEPSTSKQPDCRATVESLVLEASADRDPRRTDRALDIAMACHHIPAAW